MTALRCTAIHAPTPDAIEVLDDVRIVLDDRGTIVSIEPASGTDEGSAPSDVVVGPDQVVVPGLVDTHVHAPQWPQLGTGLDLPLERWLFEYTFPLEARFADIEYARSVWDQMVPALLAHGTTAAIYYGSRHVEATTALAEACVGHGQRALVGRVAMDHPDGTPQWYRDESPTASVDHSARSIDDIEAVADPLGLVEPIITPRFTPACTDAALAGLGELAEASGARVQTHCSESDWEHGHALDRYGTTDAHALDRFGLIRPHTVLAHATHLDDADRSLLASAGAGVAHCPLSNVYFANRPFAARAALGAGVAVGLGTDIAGGPSPSVLAQCGHAVVASQRLADDGDRDARLDLVTAFHLATAGGADLAGLPVGRFVPGASFDAIAVSLDAIGVDRDLDDWSRRFDKLVHRAGPTAFTDVWVAGRRVAGSGSRP
ncbi:MAG: amidohydrolase family protein [Actinomycetota bacterium]